MVLSRESPIAKVSYFLLKPNPSSSDLAIANFKMKLVIDTLNSSLNSFSIIYTFFLLPDKVPL